MNVMETRNPGEAGIRPLLVALDVGVYPPSPPDAIAMAAVDKEAAYEVADERHEIALQEAVDPHGALGASGLGDVAAAKMLHALSVRWFIDAMRLHDAVCVFKATGSGKSAYLGLLDAIAGKRSESEKTTVTAASTEPPVRTKARSTEASQKAIALLERFKDVPSVDPHLLRADIDRVLDPDL